MIVDRKLVDLEFLMSRSTTENHTFVATWGEFGSSMEIVAMLTPLPMFGEAQAANRYLDGEDKKKVEALKTSLSKLKYSTNNAMYMLLEKYFDEGDGMNSPYQVDVFLAYWLHIYIPELA